VARRTTKTDALDLVPADWRRAAAARLAKRRLLRVSAAVAAVWLLGISCFAGYYAWHSGGLNKLEQRASDLEEPAAQVRRLEQRVRALEQYTDRTFSVLECLREVSEKLPRGLELTSFSFKKNRDVQIRGFAVSTDKTPVLDFIDALEKSGLFESVTDQQVTLQTKDRQRRAAFKITAILPGDAS
jgi:Tfp pilus assembly protein PilN